mmetsp:Transcript_101868/g.202265  ORF Transcript_101868/g.202265 Transcript_101868/m.202265 type:complete len:416 (-) Transcript_101868:68-1315(-)
MSWCMRFLVAAAALTPLASAFAVVGYVPEYRFQEFDWDGALRALTHLVLFSMEPTADGGLNGLDLVRNVLKPGSGLSAAIAKVEDSGDIPPRVLVTIGGAGRSAHFSKVAANKKNRKRVVKMLVDLVKDFPIVSGVDMDWEAPSNLQEWREFGKLAQDIRAGLEAEMHDKGGTPLVTMGFHPLSGSVTTFSSVRGKKSEKAFVDIFDMCHAMAYSHFDGERRHSTDRIDAAAVDEWTRHGLPLRKLTLGIPFFGVDRKTGTTMSYNDIMVKYPWLKDDPDVDEAQDGVYFIGASNAARKVEFAARRGLGGVMLWELGQDAPQAAEYNLLHHVLGAADRARGWWGRFLAWLPVTQDTVYLAIVFFMGLYYLKNVLTSTPPGVKLAQRRRQKPVAVDGGPGSADGARSEQRTEPAGG